MLKVKSKLLVGYLTLLSALLLTIGIRGLIIMRGFKMAKVFGFVKHLNYSYEMKTMIWWAIPYVVMMVDLIWQQIMFKKKTIISINISSIVIASAVGIALHLLNNFSTRTDAFGMALANAAIPIIQLIVFGVARLSSRIKEVKD